MYVCGVSGVRLWGIFPFEVYACGVSGVRLWGLGCINMGPPSDDPNLLISKPKKQSIAIKGV